MKFVAFASILMLLSLANLNVWVKSGSLYQDDPQSVQKYYSNDAIRCGDTGNCNRTGCNDTSAIYPFECLGHNEEMECFRVCKDPQVLLDCIRDHHADTNKYAYCAIIYQRDILDAGAGQAGATTDHIALPCEVKCRTDPVFWTCVHKCDKRGCFRAFHDCETKPKSADDTSPFCDTTRLGYLNNIECRDCYVSNLTTELESSGECSVRYSHLIGNPSKKHDPDATGSNTTSDPNQSLAGGSTAQEGSKTKITFGDVQSKCIYYNDIEDGKKPEMNETLPFSMVVECLRDVGIVYPDIDYSNLASNGTGLDNSSQTGAPITSQQRTLTKDYLQNCIQVTLASKQLDWCLSGYHAPCEGNKGSLTCQQHCLRRLTKPFCYIPCPRNPFVEDCETECFIKYPQLECECKNETSVSRLTQRRYHFLNTSDRFERFKTRTKACADFECYYLRIHDETPHPYDPSVRNESDVEGGNVAEDPWTDEAKRARNCKSFRHLKMFSKELARAKNRPNAFKDDIEELAQHFTLFECKKLECADALENDAAICAKNCISKGISSDKSDQMCRDSKPSIFCEDTNPNCTATNTTYDSKFDHANFLRAEIVMWCLLTAFGNRTWDLNAFKTLPDNTEDYQKLLDCETNARALGKEYIPRKDMEIFANITYHLEREWCQECMLVSNARPHPYDIEHVQCEIENCYEGRINDTCKKFKNVERSVSLVSSTDCTWKVDYSLSRYPYRLWSTYFDEISPHEVVNNLTYPDTTKYLMKTVISSAKGFHAFPYFLVIRAHCDDGFYDDELYKFIASGATPVVKVTYFPFSSRTKHVNLMYSVFQSALINLERTDEFEKHYIPANPLNRKVNGTYDGKSGCHQQVCYPAFAVPQILLHIPIFEVTVQNQQIFSGIRQHTYVSTMHNRDVAGHGKVKVANTTHPPTAADFFPNEKTQVYEDVQIVDLWARLPDSGYSGGDTNRPGPEIEHLEDVNCQRFNESHPLRIGGNPYSPLDAEDFFRVQYTHGNAPQVVIAGFYDPNLVIVGDPDFRKFHLIRWGFEATGGTEQGPTPRLFTSNYKCFSGHYPFQGFTKPMYSMYDRLDPHYWLQFYRMRYFPKNYTHSQSTKAIFEAFALEDRVVLLTSGGLVSMYHNYNQTSLLGVPWVLEAHDRLERCFKIVRIAKRSHPLTDTIVAITYDYQQTEGKNGTEHATEKGQKVEDISQQVFIGRYVGAGKPIEWELIQGGISTQNLKEERVYNVGGDKLGETERLEDKKLIDIPVERRETSPRSQIEAICYIVYRNKMAKAEYIELIEDQGWCDTIDATPVVAVESKIQVLVRMKAYYSGGNEPSTTSNKKRMVFFYVVASINTDKAASLYAIWQIDSIIPRIPCQDQHTQSIPNVVQFSTKYFRAGDPDAVGSDYGCHELDGVSTEETHIFLHGMTYTRSYNSHMFLYGNKLLQSTDGGQTFVHLKSFPDKEDPEYRESCMGISKTTKGRSMGSHIMSRKAYHRIKLMAFDDLGHYAFLTSKRELWYGNLGSLVQIRLRPSPSHSMVLTTLYEVPEISEAVPFTVFFDTNNELAEMVAVVDPNGTVSRIARRSIDERTILRARHFIEQFDKVGEARFQKLAAHANDIKEGGSSEPTINSDLMKEIRYDPIKWSVFCPFTSPAYFHNFSSRFARAQSYFFPAPRQHPSLGMVHNYSSLMTYQVTTFGLVWNSYLSDMYKAYSHVNPDPFVTWNKNKRDAAVIGRLQYLNLEPHDHGVLVLPDKYRRFYTTIADAHRLFSIYYMDYNVVMKISIEYSISNDYTLNPIDYLNHRLSAIHLNVDNSNGTLIQINTDKDVVAARAAVRYVIHVSVKKNTGLPQQYSGRNAIIVPLYFHLIGGFGKCIKTESAGILGDSIATAVAVGCPPSTDLVFDWNSTIYSMKFRDASAHYGVAESNCYNNEAFCFFVRHPLVLYFHIFDDAKQKHFEFNGKFTMRIVGGGFDRDSIESFTPEEQEAYNVPSVSDVSLIWNEWDLKTFQKKEHNAEQLNKGKEIILQSGVSAIKWACHTLSPCARVKPRGNFESIYYFKVFISNRGVDNNTLCLFEKEFTMLLYGFPPSPEIQLTITVLFYIFLLLLLYVVYLFFRNKKKLWRSTLLKFQGWFQIIRDTFPKSLFGDRGDDTETEEERNRRHDEIIMSLQGHLSVPVLLNKETDGDDRDKKSEKGTLLSGDSADKHSQSSSNRSDLSQQRIAMTSVLDKGGTLTWTDLIYEQTISKRLATIVERNRKELEEEKKKKKRGEKK